MAPWALSLIDLPYALVEVVPGPLPLEALRFCFVWWPLSYELVPVPLCALVVVVDVAAMHALVMETLTYYCRSFMLIASCDQVRCHSYTFCIQVGTQFRYA